MTIDKPTFLFVGTSLVLAILVGGMTAGGWKPGSLDNSIEWLFWLGAAGAATGVVCFGFAARGTDRAEQLVKDGLVLFMGAPIVCAVAVIVNSWI